MRTTMLLLFVLSAVFACKDKKKGSESPATDSPPSNTPPTTQRKMKLKMKLIPKMMATKSNYQLYN